MTIHALATGPLWKAPEQRTAKNGNPFVTATIKVRGGAAKRIDASFDGDAGLNHYLPDAARR
jgi:hypothetical protein